MKKYFIILAYSFTLGFFSCTKNLYEPDLGLASLKEGSSMGVSSHAPTAGSNKDRIAFIQPGQTVEIFNVKGAGVINHIWMTFNEARPNWVDKEGSATPGELVIRMYWDDASEPAVEAPIGDFFASGFGLQNEINSLPVEVVRGDGYNCFWQMPFHKSARITVTDDGKKAARLFYYQFDYTKYNKLPKNTAYYCAQYRQEYPEVAGKDYLIADIQGKGQYVGTVMSVRSRSPLWFGEGDAKYYVDGSKEPSNWGTGTEDYFLSAWGFAKYLAPYSGCTYMSEGEEDPGQKYTLYRWNIKDPVRFPKSLRFEIEHKGWISADESGTGEVNGHVEREDDVATVAFWYQEGQPKRFAILPPYEERVLPNLDFIIEGKDMIDSIRHSPGTVELQKGYDWTGDGQILFTPSTNNAWLETDFILKEDEGYRALFLRMSHAPNYGNYKVFIDDKLIERVPETTDIDFTPPKKVAMVMNLYSKNLNVLNYYLGSEVIRKGKHTIRFEQVGKNDNSLGNALGFDSFRLMKRWNKKRPALDPNAIIGR
jgi:hypothetical protein